MEYEVGIVVQEDRNPVKIRRAFTLGVAGVIVDTVLPAEVTNEIAQRAAEKNDVIRCVEEAGLVLVYDAEDEKHRKWGRHEAALMHSCAWFMEQFDWAVANDFARAPNAERESGMVMLWMNKHGNLPWHIDRSRDDGRPDIHMHAHGDGLVLAKPSKPLSLHFSENRTSPHLFIKGRGWEYPPESELTQHLRDQNCEIGELQPGQIFLFNQKGLHKSAEVQRSKIKLRGAIF